MIPHSPVFPPQLSGSSLLSTSPSSVSFTEFSLFFIQSLNVGAPKPNHGCLLHAILSPEASFPVPITLKSIFIPDNTEMYYNSLCSEVQILIATLLFDISIWMSHNDLKPKGPKPKRLILFPKFAFPPPFSTSFHVTAQARITLPIFNSLLSSSLLCLHFHPPNPSHQIIRS